MSVWTAFFLVVSIVILAAPLVLSREAPGRTGYGSTDASDGGSGQGDDELELDLAAGRLTRADYEAMSGKKLNSTEPDGGARGGHGSIPES